MKKEINKSSKKVLQLIDLIFFIFICLTFVFKDYLNSLLYPLIISALMYLTFIAILFLGFRKSKKNREKIRINNIYIAFTILYVTTIYLCGNATAYQKTSFNILDSIYLIIIMILLEVLRYTYLRKCNKNSFNQHTITFLYTLFDILLLSSMSPQNPLSIMSFISTTIISLIKNILLSYTSYRYGYNCTFLYSFTITYLPMIAPIYPELGNYLSVIFSIIYSSTIFYNISKPSRKEDEETLNTYQTSIGYYIERLTLVLLIIMIILISGVAPYQISAIASDSMYPEIKKGDAIIIEKLNSHNEDKLVKNTIIAFKDEDTIVTHRILETEITEDGELLITTKGDNNSTKDVTKRKKDDIIGIVMFRIPYIGYPSVEISEIKNKNNKE